MKLPNPCPICIHPQRSTIEGLMQEGIPGREIAEAYDLKQYVVEGHRVQHLGLRLGTGRPLKVISTAVQEEAPSAELKPRALTVEERAAVRALLDRHFDDERGAYVIGYSDKRVGIEAEVPWRAVTNLREAAYGPILIDPEMEELHNRLAGLDKNEQRLVEQLAEAQRLLTSLRADMEALRVDLKRKIGG